MARTLNLIEKAKKNNFISFIIEVIEKYNQDSGSKNTALLTYYAFLSVFPLLLVFTTVTSLLVGNNSHIGKSLVKSVNNYFPSLGQQLTTNVHQLHKTGWPLLIGVILSFYGARGVASNFMNFVQDAWHVPKSARSKFPENIFRSLVLLIVGAIGFVFAAACAGFTASAGSSIYFKVLSLVVNFTVLYLLFIFLINYSLNKHGSIRRTRLGAIFATVCLIILESLGGIIIAKELKKLDSLYSYYAIALGLLFWLYLQIQVMYYAIEVSIISTNKISKNLASSKKQA